VSWPGVEERRGDDGVDFELVERDLSWVRIDYQTRLQFGEAEVVIEGPFHLRIDGVDHFLDPADRRGLGPVLTLYPGRVDSLHMQLDGTLIATFEGGSVLTVPPDDRYEAWNVGGFWCPPGGFPNSA
jgi:hypothetical protein